MTKQHVFITGGTGFIGQHAVEKFLSEGWGVSVFSRADNPSLQYRWPKVSFFKGDIRDPHSLMSALNEIEVRCGKPPDVIVHCAARVTDIGRRKDFHLENFSSTVALGKYTLARSLIKFVYVSTTDVYGLKDFHLAKESNLSVVCFPKNPYPEFKIASERWIEDNLPPDRYSIVRPAAVWGPGDKTLVPRAVDYLAKSPWIFHFGRWKGKNRWPMAYVKNVAAAVFLAATSHDAQGKAFHVLDTERTSIQEFYEMLLKIYLPLKKSKVIHLPFWMGRLIGAVISFASKATNVRRPLADPTHYAVYSISKNLDFDNRFFLELMRRSEEKVWSKEEGIEELINHAKIEKQMSLN